MEGVIVRKSVFQRLDQMIGDLFYQGVKPAEIKGMTWTELKYWHKWHEIIQKAKLPKEID